MAQRAGVLVAGAACHVYWWTALGEWLAKIEVGESSKRVRSGSRCRLGTCVGVGRR